MLGKETAIKAGRRAPRVLSEQPKLDPETLRRKSEHAARQQAKGMER
jgi:hypothetical protein